MKKWMLLFPLILCACGCSSDRYVLREGIDAVCRPMWAEHMEWSKERAAEGKLTATDLKIRQDASAAYSKLINDDRARDSRGLFSRP